MFKVASKEERPGDVVIVELEVAEVAEKVWPGHHVDISVNVDSTPVTLPVSDFDRERGTVTVVARVDDESTRRFASLDAGDEVFQVRGPLGGNCTIESLSKVVLVGEGVGVGSLLGRAREFKRKDVYTICIVGFPTKDHIFWEEAFAEVSDELYVVTEDGSYGVSGKVIGPLRAVCETQHDVERLIVIASLSTMKRAAKIAGDHEIGAWVCFDDVHTAGLFDVPDSSQEAFTFARAPEIAAGDVDFDKLIAKARALQKEALDSPQP